MAKPLAVITGASRGIGRAIALRLARTHDIVAVAHNEHALEELARVIGQAGGACTVVPLDLADAAAVARSLKGVDADVLVNNAGTGPMKPMLELSPDEWQR